MAKRTKSGIKRILIAERNRFRNVSTKSTIKTAIRKLDASLEGDDTEVTKGNLAAAISRIDKAVSKGIIHKNTAARKKSRMVKRVNNSAKATA